MASSTNLVHMAKSLPPPLQRFFARWPPAAIVPEGTAPTRYQQERPNPFTFIKHPATGKWQGPVYSQRRQAELVKMARAHGVEELLPETTKGTEYKLAYRVEHGLRVKGTGVGQKVKGHIHERHMIAKYVRPAALRTRCVTKMADHSAVWKRRERPCWKCQTSSRPGRGYVVTPPEALAVTCHELIVFAAWKEELDQVPEIRDHRGESVFRAPSPVVQLSLCMNRVWHISACFFPNLLVSYVVCTALSCCR